MPEEYDFASIKAIDDAYNLCKEAGFVKQFLDKKEKRDAVLPELPRDSTTYEPFDKYINVMCGILLFLNDRQDKKKTSFLPSELIDKVSELIPKYFPNVKVNKSNAFSIIALAILKWLIERMRAKLGVIYYPPKK